MKKIYDGKHLRMGHTVQTLFYNVFYGKVQNDQ